MSTEYYTDLQFYSPMDINTAASVDDVNTVAAILESCLKKKKETYLCKRNKDGWMPLMYAAQNGSERVLLYLLKAGAVTFIQNSKGQDALMLAASYGHKKSVEILVQHGVDLDATDHKCWTPLFHAVSSGQHLIVQFLLRKKCLVNLRDNDGMTPLMMAAVCGHELIVEDLLNFGADALFCLKDGRRARNLAILYNNNKIVDVLDSYAHSSESKTIEVRKQLRIMLSETVQEILDNLELSKYYPLFKDQEIDLDKFWTLTDKNLMDIGMKLLGPRRKIMYTISKRQEWMICTKPNAQSSDDKLPDEIKQRTLMMQKQTIKKMELVHTPIDCVKDVQLDSNNKKKSQVSIEMDPSRTKYYKREDNHKVQNVARLPENATCTNPHIPYTNDVVYPDHHVDLLIKNFKQHAIVGSQKITTLSF